MDPNKKKKWNEIAEVRMLLYVIPVAIIFIVIAAVLSNCGG